jgi:ABC-type polysaccharide/polyol phosphate transport system ATPase subunit
MSVAAIEFESVSKRYVVRAQRMLYLKDRLTQAVRRIGVSERRVSNGTREAIWALRDVSFRIEPGESVGIIGPNGSGKSTVFKILAGVTTQTSGRVGVHGKLGALIELGAGFHPELTGRENVFLNGSILGIKKADIARMFDAIVAFAEVEQFIDTPVKHYSSGMYVRLGFAIAIHTNPDILLIDEVLAVGDLSFQRKCFQRMLEFRRDGHTFVLISHSMPHIKSLCNRVMMLDRGQLVANGSPAEVTEIYARQQGEPEADIAQTDTASGIRIIGTKLMDVDGNPIVTVDPLQAVVFEIEFEAQSPIPGAIGWLHLSREDLRVFDSDTRSLDIDLGTLDGKGTLRCELPGLPLMPNSYDVHVGVLDPDLNLLVHVRYPRMLTIVRYGSNSEMGCCWIADASQRGLVYGRAGWSRTSTVAAQRGRAESAAAGTS